MHVKLFFIALAAFLITDMIWLGFIAKNLYIQEYREWLRLYNDQLQPLWWPVLIVYFLFALAVVVFIIPLAAGSIVYALIYGAILGAVIYGIYDFTNLAIFKEWPIRMAFVDWAWGTFLCAFSSMVTVYFSK